jgi:hypothetical protein
VIKAYPQLRSSFSSRGNAAIVSSFPIRWCLLGPIAARLVQALSRGGMVGSASGKQIDAEAAPGGRPVALRFADDARGC